MHYDRMQIDAIRRLDETLGAAGIDYWLFGGWAVDFWLGRVTRAHDDVDAAAWRRERDAIDAALVATGWRRAPADDEVVAACYTWRTGELLEFTFVERREDGSMVIPFADREVVWTSEPFGDERRELCGVQARVIPLDVLRRGKQHPREAPDDAAKDVADFRALGSPT
jgi:hypothetical protein